MSDIEKALRDEIAAITAIRREPMDRIRITPLIPTGAMFLCPYEKDGSLPGPGRTIGNGPAELLINADDWRALVTPYSYSGVSAPLSLAGMYMGIPVIDDTRV